MFSFTICSRSLVRPGRLRRHPGYLAMLTTILASAVAIGSWFTLIPVAGFCAVVAWGTRRQDKL